MNGTRVISELVYVSVILANVDRLLTLLHSERPKLHTTFAFLRGTLHTIIEALFFFSSKYTLAYLFDGSNMSICKYSRSYNMTLSCL